jgi:hypothetical protein
MMSVKRFMVITSLAVLPVVSAASSTMAQSPPPAWSPPYTHPRIEVNPRPAYRRCASWYVIQYRPSGTVLFPEKHCWWQR